jgi:hypothetical protein
MWLTFTSWLVVLLSSDHRQRAGRLRAHGGRGERPPRGATDDGRGGGATAARPAEHALRAGPLAGPATREDRQSRDAVHSLGSRPVGPREFLRHLARLHLKLTGGHYRAPWSSSRTAGSRFSSQACVLSGSDHILSRAAPKAHPRHILLSTWSRVPGDSSAPPPVAFRLGYIRNAACRPPSTALAAKSCGPPVGSMSSVLVGFLLTSRATPSRHWGPRLRSTWKTCPEGGFGGAFLVATVDPF